MVMNHRNKRRSPNKWRVKLQQPKPVECWVFDESVSLNRTNVHITTHDKTISYNVSNNVKLIRYLCQFTSLKFTSGMDMWKMRCWKLKGKCEIQKCSVTIHLIRFISTRDLYFCSPISFFRELINLQRQTHLSRLSEFIFEV